MARTESRCCGSKGRPPAEKEAKDRCQWQMLLGLAAQSLYARHEPCATGARKKLAPQAGQERVQRAIGTWTRLQAHPTRSPATAHCHRPSLLLPAAANLCWRRLVTALRLHYCRGDTADRRAGQRRAPGLTGTGDRGRQQRRSMSKAQLLEDIFEVLEKDPDGKKFDKGARGPGAGSAAHVAVRHAVAAAAQAAP